MSRLANRTARLRKLEELLMLSNQGMSVIDLAEALQVNRRTVYRDLEFLSTQEVPLWQDGGIYGIQRTSYLANIRLTYHEAMALVLAGLLLARTIDEHNPHVIAALRRLSAALPEFPGEHLLRAAGRVENHPQNPVQVAVLEAVLDAWGQGRKVKITYRSPGSGTLRERNLSPYALEPTASGLYVLGFDDWSGEIRTFKLERMENARLTSEPYSIPDDFDFETYQASSWGIIAGPTIQEVVLRFSPSARPYVLERQWHASQKLEDTPEGGCLLHVWVNEPLEMQPWIRSWGAQVEVLAPDGLRSQIAEELNRAARQYDGQYNPAAAIPEVVYAPSLAFGYQAIRSLKI